MRFDVARAGTSVLAVAKVPPWRTQPARSDAHLPEHSAAAVRTADSGPGRRAVKPGVSTVSCGTNERFVDAWSGGGDVDCSGKPGPGLRRACLPKPNNLFDRFGVSCK